MDDIWPDISPSNLTMATILVAGAYLGVEMLGLRPDRSFRPMEKGPWVIPREPVLVVTHAHTPESDACIDAIPAGLSEVQTRTAAKECKRLNPPWYFRLDPSIDWGDGTLSGIIPESYDLWRKLLRRYSTSDATYSDAPFPPDWVEWSVHVEYWHPAIDVHKYENYIPTPKVSSVGLW
jgi:hypothetical protein